MYPVSDDYKTAIAASVKEGQTVTGTITLIDDTVITIGAEDILSGSLCLSEQCVSSEDIEVGNVYASQLEMTLVIPISDPYSLAGARVFLNYGIITGEEEDETPIWEYVPLGYFYVTEIERKTNNVAITALDGMILFDVALGTTTTTGVAYDIVSSCCTTAGVTLGMIEADFAVFPNYDLSVSLPTGSEVETCRDLLMWVCQLLGCFARMDKAGELELVRLINPTTVTNLCPNSDFSDGTTGWTPIAASLSVSDGELHVTADGTAVCGYVYRQDLDTVDVSHIYYVRAKVRVTDAVCTKFDMYYDGSTAETATVVKTITTPAQDTEYTMSVATTPPEDSTGDFKFAIRNVYASAEVATDKVMIMDNVIALDLTAIFGAGSEPTATVMDGYVDYYLAAQGVNCFTSAELTSPELMSIRTFSKGERYSPSTVSDTEVQITKVIMDVGGTEYTSGTDGMTLTLDENPLLAEADAGDVQDALDNILAEITRTIYAPVNFDCFGDPSLQCGDYITLDDTSALSGDPLAFITHSTWKFRGKHNIQSVGKSAPLRSEYQHSQIKKALSKITATANSASTYAQAASQAALLLNSAIKGNVLIRENGENNEILIMDSIDPDTATKMWRFNINGWGYSNNCVGADNAERTYTIAATMDGVLTANKVVAAEGTFTDLTAGIEGAQRIDMGEDSNGDPYLYVYDDSNTLQLSVTKEGLFFSSTTRFVKYTIGTRSGVGVFVA
jgi:hypothetical protein